MDLNLLYLNCWSELQCSSSSRLIEKESKFVVKRGDSDYTVCFMSDVFGNQCYTLKSEKLEKEEIGI